MAKAVVFDGKTYRMRRGKMVQIPDQWVGRITTNKTIRRRPSKAIGKLKKYIKHGEYSGHRYKSEGPTVSEFE